MNRQVAHHSQETQFSLFEEGYLCKHPAIMSGHWPLIGQLDVWQSLRTRQVMHHIKETYFSLFEITYLYKRFPLIYQVVDL